MNENALTGTYLGSQAVTESTTDAFVIVPDYAPIYMSPDGHGLPVFLASVTGFGKGNPYFLFDFT